MTASFSRYSGGGFCYFIGKMAAAEKYVIMIRHTHHSFPPHKKYERRSSGDSQFRGSSTASDYGQCRPVLGTSRQDRIGRLSYNSEKLGRRGDKSISDHGNQRLVFNYVFVFDIVQRTLLLHEIVLPSIASAASGNH